MKNEKQCSFLLFGLIFAALQARVYNTSSLYQRDRHDIRFDEDKVKIRFYGNTSYINRAGWRPTAGYVFFCKTFYYLVYVIIFENESAGRKIN